LAATNTEIAEQETVLIQRYSVQAAVKILHEIGLRVESGDGDATDGGDNFAFITQKKSFLNTSENHHDRN
jgi:hypothetical protein